MALRLFGYACNTAELSLPMYAPIFLRLSVSHPPSIISTLISPADRFMERV